MDGRDAFLTMARDRHLEFSSLRRCKYSSLAMLYELHTQAMVRFLILEFINRLVKEPVSRFATKLEHDLLQKKLSIILLNIC